MMPIDDYASYLIRLWSQRDGKIPCWHGELESIQSGHARQFQDMPSLFQLLQAYIEAGSRQEDGPDDEGQGANP